MDEFKQYYYEARPSAIGKAFGRWVLPAARLSPCSKVAEAQSSAKCLDLKEMPDQLSTRPHPTRHAVWRKDWVLEGQDTSSPQGEGTRENPGEKERLTSCL